MKPLAPFLSGLTRAPSDFVREARARGVPAATARALELAAQATCADDPLRVLDSRELFERTAKQTVMGDAGNLELSFDLVDRLAQAVEQLKLGRVSDVPDPFRRVWVADRDGQRVRGVVFRHELDELAVFCPPGERRLGELGSTVTIGYRGFASSVDYDLLVDDSVRLPEALVLHLKHESGSGRIGRRQDRYPVELRGSLRLVDRVAGAEGRTAGELHPCTVVDVSLGGLGLVCDAGLGSAEELGREARLEVRVNLGAEAGEGGEADVVYLPEESRGTGDDQLALRVAVCIVRSRSGGELFLGTELRDVEDAVRARFEGFVQSRRRGLSSRA